MAIIFEAVTGDALPLFGFDQTNATVRNNLLNDFPTVENLGGEEDFSVVNDADIPGLRNIRCRYQEDNRVVKSFQSTLNNLDEAWLSYDLFFEDTHPGFGFDFGNEARDSGDPNLPRWERTIMKMHGLSNDIIQNSGGLSTDEGFSSRTYILGAGTQNGCLLYTSPSPRDKRQSRMPSSA